MSDLSRAVASVLEDGGFTDVFTTVPSAAWCAEPIVVRQGDFSRGARTSDGDRGSTPVTVSVVRESPREGGRVAFACEDLLRSPAWERHSRAGELRVCGVDTTVPHLSGRDSSGRYVWEFTADLSVARR